jgi:hypothetical protein
MGLLLIKAMVREGLGYTVLTYGSVYMEVEAGTMTAEPLTPEVTWTLCMAHNHEQRMLGPVQAVMEIIRWAALRLGGSIIIIEHDMSLVKELAQIVYVLHNGALLAKGNVAAIQADPAVRAVYVGGEK